MVNILNITSGVNRAYLYVVFIKNTCFLVSKSYQSFMHFQMEPKRKCKIIVIPLSYMLSKVSSAVLFHKLFKTLQKAICLELFEDDTQ